MKNRVVALVVCSLLVFLTADLALAEWQIEYSDRLVNAMREAEYQCPKRVGHFATKAECEKARESASRATGCHPYSMADMKCVGYDTPSSIPRSVTPQPGKISRGVRGDGRYQDEQNWLIREQIERWAKEERERELERQKEFELGKSDLLKMLKGVGGEQGLALKPPPVVNLSDKETDTLIKPIEVPVPRLHPNDFKKSPVMSAEDSPLIRLPKLPEIPEWVRKEVEKTPSRMVELAITAVRGGAYLKVFKINARFTDYAIGQIEKFMDLARRGFPERESEAFLRRQDWEPFGILFEGWTSLPVPPYAEDEKNKAQSWFWKPLF